MALPKIVFHWNWGISINEGEFPNLVMLWQKPYGLFFYMALSRRWKFIFGHGNRRFGPINA